MNVLQIVSDVRQEMKPVKCVVKKIIVTVGIICQKFMAKICVPIQCLKLYALETLQCWGKHSFELEDLKKKNVL